MTRIVAGTLGGRRITAPEGLHTRPTSDRVREGLFSALESMTEIQNARFADLYAGSGAVGIEALSRGAAHALFVESNPRAARIILENLATLGATTRATLTAAKVATVLSAAPGGPYDIVFADPPYAVLATEVDAMLAALVQNRWLAVDAVVVLERSSRSPEPGWPHEITPRRHRRYGESILWYGRGS